MSVLDQSPVPDGGTEAEALRASLALARAAEELGFARYWVAEHHGSAAFAGAAPEVMVGAVLAVTTSMRVGSGGVLLPRYPSVKVAEVFRILSALHPGRVDLGVGRAGGPAADFPRKLVELLARLGPEPPVWLLGASTGSAELAARLGTAYCFAHFLNSDPGEAAMSRYHAGGSVRGDVASPSSGGDAVPEPRGAVAVRVMVADTAGEADALAEAFLLWRSRRDLGHDETLPGSDRVRRHRWTPAELDRAAVNRRTLVHGTAEQARTALIGLADAHGVCELVVNTLTHDPADRLRSYRLLAEAMADTMAAPDTMAHL
ncbi:luciferase family oxidoreductase [Saccharothrix sp. ALI-22-I]|nr:luciferase family oxidoreductase [Saccharothrix sp. ALI-22-I]